MVTPNKPKQSATDAEKCAKKGAKTAGVSCAVSPARQRPDFATQKPSAHSKADPLARLQSMDIWEFCRSGAEVAFQTPIGRFTRLLEACHAGMGEREAHKSPLLGAMADKSGGGGFEKTVTWRASGQCNRAGQCHVRLTGEFVAVSVCLRCNGPVSEALVFDRRLRLCKSEQEADTLETEDDEDAVAAPGKVNLLEWLEDELLLSLPMFPAHAEGQCVAETLFVAGPLAPDNVHDMAYDARVQAQNDGGETYRDEAQSANSQAVTRPASNPAGPEPTEDRESRSGLAPVADTHRPFGNLADLLKKPGRTPRNQ